MRSGHFTCQGAEGLRLGGSAWQRGAGLCGKGAEQGSRPSAGSGLCERDVFAAEFVCDLEPASISGHCPFPSFLNFSVPRAPCGAGGRGRAAQLCQLRVSAASGGDLGARGHVSHYQTLQHSSLITGVLQG